MIRLAKRSIERPKTALAVWLAIAAVLSVIGFGVAKTLSPPISVVPGTQSSRAQRLANAKFGPTQLVPILLEGPRAQLNRQGPALVLALARRPHTRVLSAWDAGTASAGLRPQPTAAMIVVSVDRSEQNAVRYDQPQIENLVSQKITAPVKSYITGQPSIDRAERSASISTLRRDELLAVGIVFLLLLVGLRAPVAALAVTAVGGISMLSGFGLVALLGHVLTLDPVGVAAGTMTGLALGVAFALLVLDRFRREREVADDSAGGAATAATRSLETTGRAVLVGGGAVVVALALVALIGPTQLMVSVGTGALVCAMFATGGAVVVMPAALVLLGRRIDALRFPAPTFLSRAWAAVVSGGNCVTRYAVFAGIAATALLAAIAVPAFALNSGPSDISQLPSSSKARIAFEEVSRVMGPGWATPYNVIVVANNRPLTTPALLSGLYRFQLRIAKDPTVDSVTGPGAINSTSKQLSTFGPQLKHSAKVSEQSKVGLLKLINGLGAAGTGSAEIQAGLAEAAAGASRLQGGSGQAQAGAGKLHTGSGQAQAGAGKLQAGSSQAQSGAGLLRAGLAKAHAGSATLAAGLTQALQGARALKSGAGQALSGSQRLVSGLGQATSGAKLSTTALKGLASVTAGTAAQISSATKALDAMKVCTTHPAQCGPVKTALGNAAYDANNAAADAKYLRQQAPALVDGLQRLQAGAGQLSAGIAQLRNGNAQLATGLGKLNAGGGQLTAGLGQLQAGAGALQIGLGQLTAGAGKLEAGLGQLTNGTGALQNGLGQLTTGSGTLASGLAGGVGPAGTLTTGLGTMQAAVIKARGQIPSTAQLKQLERQSPGLFNSGYFVLAAIEGATAPNRNAATFTINLLRGGTAGQIMVVSKYKASDARTKALGTRLANLGQSFGKRNDTQVAVGGPAGNLSDLTHVTQSRIWIDVAVLAAAIVLTLAVALRAVLLPVVATMFGLLTTAAAFGVLQLLFGGPNPPLDGPGYLDPTTIIAVFTLAFSTSVIFSALLLASTREAFVKDGRGREAVRTGLRRTAAAATGAGLVMVAALIPFATTAFLNIRALGIGVAVAILLDVLIVRPVLLPAAQAVLGRYGWWPTSAPAPGRPEAKHPPDRLPRLPVRRRTAHQAPH
ncbi:MAG TPA: MMPL family transporter [Solirubrobacteraceae bacterium]|nr:MMPL family transporter [Solirubrobacteraceae bacterium]